MNEYVDKLIADGILLGDWDEDKVSGLHPSWFIIRQVDMLDMRGDLQIRCNQTIGFGRHVRIITASHDITHEGINGSMWPRRVWIDKHVFVGSYALLYNCHLQEHSIVSVGSVVRNMTVPPYSIVEGNPAKVVRVYKDGIWRKVGEMYLE